MKTVGYIVLKNINKGCVNMTVYFEKNRYRVYKDNKAYASYSIKKFKKYAKLFAYITDKTNIKFKNIILKENDYYKMIIFNKRFGQCNILFDSDDLKMVMKYQWYIDANSSVNAKPYCKTVCSKKNTYLHIKICNPFKYINKVVDHINRNTLDNRFCNLRLISKKKNNLNKSKYSNNHSGFT